MLRFLMPAILTVAATAQSVLYYSAALDNAQENPPTNGNGHGWSIVRLDTTTGQVNIFIYYESLTGAPTAAHLHQAPVGVNGGVIVPCSPSGTNSFSGTGTLSAAQITAFIGNGTYVNVHTAANPGGEIRGQVVPSTSTRFTAIMSGAQETPPNPSTATGTAVAFLHQPENRVVYVVNSSGLVSVTAAHFHQGAPGVAGPVVIPLNGSSGTYGGVSGRLSAAQVAQWQAGNFYANIHTSSFPGGEIRGQMIPDAGDHWVAAADGAQETPPTGAPGLAGASLIVGANGVITVNGGFSGMSGTVFLAHVHFGPIGIAGAIIIPLTITGSTLSGTYTPTPADLTNLRAGNWYLNLHTALNPGGEVRGQFVPAKLPTTFGEGCPTSAGTRPQAAATGFAGVGSAVSLDLYGAIPGSLLVFAFGASRDLGAGSVPLPIELTSVGVASPRCYVLVDPATTLVQFANGLGNSSLLLNVPFLPSLRGGTFYTQWFVFDAAASPGGLVTSSALSFTIQ
jgi:hypothetical protein